MNIMTGAVLVRLAQMRKARGLTQVQFAEKAGVSRQTIISLEKGNFKAIETETIVKISDALGGIDWLKYEPDPGDGGEA